MTDRVPYIDLWLEFSTDQPFPDEDYTHYRLAAIKRLDNTIPDDSVLGIQETLAQSDFGFIDLPNGIIEALDGSPVEFKSP